MILVLAAILGADPARGSDPPRSGSASSGSSIGFATRSGEKQREAEAHALTVPTPDNARQWLRTLTAEPHVAGTPADHKTAVFVRDKLREWGWKAEIAEMEVLLNYPYRPSLKLERPIARDFNLDEAPIATDKDSASTKAFGAFNGYGASGEVSGQVVYANYGRPDDFAALEKMGIDVKDKIVLARYGELFRGLKVWNAQKRGARGILIFSDPADDGYAKGDVYPHGRFRPGSAIQRGSVQFLSLGPGDPSTPFGPSVKGAKRLPLSVKQSGSMIVQGRQVPGLYDEDWEKQTGMKLVDTIAIIPSLPISYDTAHEILKVLAGPNVPSGWQGGLPLAYHVGPGPAEVQLKTSMDYEHPPDLERDRDDPRHGRARPMGHDRQPSRRLGLRRGRPQQRHGRDARDVPRPGRRREARLETQADPRLRELGCRGIRPGRLDRVGRGARRGSQEEGRPDAERRLGRQRAGAHVSAECHPCVTSCWKSAGAVTDVRSGKKSARPLDRRTSQSLGLQLAAASITIRSGMTRQTAVPDRTRRRAGNSSPR